MIKVENITVTNFENAIRGMRNPLASWDKSDSKWCWQVPLSNINCNDCVCSNSCLHNYGESDGNYIIGPNDMRLAQRLIKAGSDERKFLRQIFVSMDITAPRFWWPEMDQYKVSTVTNSTSTMHTLVNNPITEEMFSMEKCDGICSQFAYELVQECEYLRLKYLDTKDKRYWYALIAILPQSFNQTRTWTANYETLRNIYHARKNHKLDCWKDFCKVIETLPYAKELICG